MMMWTTRWAVSGWALWMPGLLAALALAADVATEHVGAVLATGIVAAVTRVFWIVPPARVRRRRVPPR